MPGSQGHVCELNAMLAEYYEARGWVDGVVPAGKLAELGIEYDGMAAPPAATRSV